MSSGTSPPLQSYWVWFDPLLEEHFWIEDGELARDFLAKMKPEGVSARQIDAASPSAALQEAFPDRKERALLGSRRHQ